MPRRHRIDLGHICYHIINRRVARLPLFETDADYLAFENALDEAATRFEMRILAYCLMPNHWHLVPWPRRDGTLSRFMHWLTVTHMRRWHEHRRSTGTGPVYQGRFRSFPIQQDDHLLTVCRYVERNPICANLVPRAQDWAWSSPRRRDASVSLPPWLLPPNEWPVESPLLSARWLPFVNRPQTPAEEAALRQSVNRGTPFGHPAWQHRTAARLHLQSSLRDPWRPRSQKGVRSTSSGQP